MATYNVGVPTKYSWMTLPELVRQIDQSAAHSPIINELLTRLYEFDNRTVADGKSVNTEAKLICPYCEAELPLVEEEE